jgi:hypothetical protein
MARQIRIPTERKLVRSIKSGRPAETAGVVIIDRRIDEVLVGGCG